MRRAVREAGGREESPEKDKKMDKKEEKKKEKYYIGCGR